MEKVEAKIRIFSQAGILLKFSGERKTMSSVEAVDETREVCLTPLALLFVMGAGLRQG